MATLLTDVAMNFDDLGLAPDLVRVLGERRYRDPTPIQRRTIPLVLDGCDLLAAAQTGTGKTAAFVLPILQRLAFVGQARRRQVRALVLAPTRELALQVHESVLAYGHYLQLRSAVVFGGVKAGPQIQALAQGVDTLLATPGRLLDLAQQGAVDFSALEVLVLDEADRMLDMGFIHDIRRIVDQLPRNRQTLMFSATFSKDIRSLATRYLIEPETVEISPPNSTTELVQQSVYRVSREGKTALLTQLVKEQNWQQVLVFTRTKHGANRLCKKLLREGIESAAIHGNKSQNARQRALAAFKEGALQVLVATDIAARGLDIDQLPHVVNFDLPAVPEDYVHRIGRTGRAGATGQSHSLVTDEDEPLLRAIEKLTRQKVRRLSLPEGFQAPAPEPEAQRDEERPRRTSTERRASNTADAPGKKAPTRRRRRRRRSRSDANPAAGAGNREARARA